MKKHFFILNTCLIFLGSFSTISLQAQQKTSADSLVRHAVAAIKNGNTAELNSDLQKLERADASADQVFLFFDQFKEQIDRVKRPNYSLSQQQAAIYRQYFTGIENTKTAPDWKQIKNNLFNKYGNAYEQPYLLARTNYHHSNGELEDLAKYGEELRKKYPEVLTPYVLNNLAFDIFKAVGDKKILNIALNWSEESITKVPNSPHYLDTYANLLHRLGETTKAITYEEKAYSLADDFQKKEILPFLEKMKTGQRTW